jgi:hypothetical protein
MADENEGGGSGLSGLMDKKVFGVPLPLVGGLVIAVAIVLYRMFGSKSGTSGSPGQGTQFSSSTTSTNPQTGVSTSYTASGDGYLPGTLTYGAGPMPISGGDIYINNPAPTNTSTTPPSNGDWLDSYGATQIAQIQSLVGKQGGYQQQVVDDVKAAYNAEIQKYGQAYADANHYSWIGPGNVQAIPKHLTMAQQITTNLPSNPVWGQVNPQALQVAPPANDSPSSPVPAS